MAFKDSDNRYLKISKKLIIDIEDGNMTAKFDIYKNQDVKNKLGEFDKVKDDIITFELSPTDLDSILKMAYNSSKKHVPFNSYSDI